MSKALARSSFEKLFHDTGVAAGAPGRARSDHGRIAVAVFLLRSQSMKMRPFRNFLLIVATKRSGAWRASPRANPAANISVSAQPSERSSGRTTCTPLPPVEHRPGAKPDVAQIVAQIERRLADGSERHVFVRIEIEDHAVRALRIVATRHPAVQFNRPELRGGVQPDRAVERKIGFAVDLARR